METGTVTQVIVGGGVGIMGIIQGANAAGEYWPVGGHIAEIGMDGGQIIKVAAKEK